MRKDQVHLDQNPFNFPSKVYLAINNNSLMVCDRTLLVLQSFTLNQIMKWGFSPNNFILIIENKNGTNDIKQTFKTKMSSEIVHVLNTILNIKQGKLPGPNSLIVNENVTREIYETDFFKKSNVFHKKKIAPEGVP